jgi:hypothetical protein
MNCAASSRQRPELAGEQASSAEGGGTATPSCRFSHLANTIPHAGQDSGGVPPSGAFR